MSIRNLVESAVGDSVREIRPLSGGSVGQVFEVVTAGAGRFVAKLDEGAEPRLDIEAFMLTYLQQNSDLPVPAVVAAEPHLLIMTFLPGQSSFSQLAQRHAAELLAGLHGITDACYGLGCPTLIGGLLQPNEQSDSWKEFFATQRVQYMARQGVEAGRLPASIATRLDRLIGRLDLWLREPSEPALIHGDIWTTNVLAKGDRISGFLDPAIYFADPEIELAFITLFDSFGQTFFERYHELRPIAPGFFEERRHIYNLYPLLVHVRLFGGGYVARVEQTLRRFGF